MTVSNLSLDLLLTPFQLSGQRSKTGEDVGQSITNTITSITGTLGL